MPSYQQPRKYFSRHELLRQLREKAMHRDMLLQVFQKTIGKLLPRKKVKSGGSGYTERNSIHSLDKFSRRSFKKFLDRLAGDALITISSKNNNDQVNITERGRNWLKKFEATPHLVSPSYSPSAEKAERVTIVSYDIPENFHIYRDWLRIVLKSLNLTMLHQSVWIGKVKLPEDFITDILRYKLEKYIEIFEITKSGTLMHKM